MSEDPMHKVDAIMSKDPMLLRYDLGKANAFRRIETPMMDYPR